MHNKQNNYTWSQLMLHEPWWSLGFLQPGEFKLLLVLWTAIYTGQHLATWVDLPRGNGAFCT